MPLPPTKRSASPTTSSSYILLTASAPSLDQKPKFLKNRKKRHSYTNTSTSTLTNNPNRSNVPSSSKSDNVNTAVEWSYHQPVAVGSLKNAASTSSLASTIATTATTATTAAGAAGNYQAYKMEIINQVTISISTHIYIYIYILIEFY